jgi:hypothetical protein
MPTLDLTPMQQRMMKFQFLPHNTSWEPFPMSTLFDTVPNQPIPYGYEELGCIIVGRKQIEVILPNCNFSMV